MVGVLMALALVCQEEGWKPQRLEGETVRREFRPFVGTGLWAAHWDFEVQTAAREADIEGDFAVAAEVGAVVGLGRGAELLVEFEYAAGDDIALSTGIIGIGYGWKGFGEVLGDPLGQRWSVGLGLLVGRVDVTASDFPGDFDLGWGLQGTMEWRLLLTESFGLRMKLGLRWSRFGYDAPDDTVDGDDELGGLAGLLSFGAELRY